MTREEFDSQTDLAFEFVQQVDEFTDYLAFIAVRGQTEERMIRLTLVRRRSGEVSAYVVEADGLHAGTSFNIPVEVALRQIQKGKVMDPNATVTELVKFAEAVKLAEDQDRDTSSFADEVGRVAELIQALDQWLSNGGFLPGRWAR